MNILQTEIKKRLEEKDISISALERDANLKKGTLYNIVYGRSKNPRIDSVQAIARQLGCSVAELYGQKEEVMATPAPIASAEIAGETVHARPVSKITEWNGKLYSECLQLVRENCERRGFIADKVVMLGYIEEIYDYSLNHGTDMIDVMYGEWILRRNLFKEV
jgi:transcriptional regulator with XRE-family HTH domain